MGLSRSSSNALGGSGFMNFFCLTTVGLRSWSTLAFNTEESSALNLVGIINGLRVLSMPSPVSA